jgi:DNA-binding GntR family transcriptional regulator
MITAMHIKDRQLAGPREMSKASDRAYKVIRDLILSGELGPGAQLKEEELAELCGVSRTPVRDAMRRLEAEMFISRTESQRSFVPVLTADDIADVFALRVRLEGYAAARAARLITAAQLEALQLINSHMDAALAADGPQVVDAFIDNNRRFHAILVEAAQSDRVRMMISRVVAPPIVRKTALLYDREKMQRSHQDHVELVDALVSRDPHWAEAVMGVHIRRAFHTYSGE